MRGVSNYRLPVAVGAFAAVLLPLLKMSEEAENFWPALIGALAVAGIALLLCEENWGQTLSVGIAFLVGLFAGNAVLAPRPGLPGNVLIGILGVLGIPVGVVCAVTYSVFIHRHDKRPKG